MKSAQKKYKSKFRVSFSVWGGGDWGGSPPLPRKLVSPLHVSLTDLTQK